MLCCSFALLAIVDQPIPQVLFKGKTIEDQYAAQLVVGAGQEVQTYSKVRASLVSEERNWKPYVEQGATVVQCAACLLEAYWLRNSPRFPVLQTRLKTTRHLSTFIELQRFKA
jgi:hypothetical protein